MNAYASSNTSGYHRSVFSQRLEDFMDSATDEARHAAAYVDTVIVPEVRREVAGAARTVAYHLERLAEKLDPQGTAGRKPNP